MRPIRKRTALGALAAAAFLAVSHTAQAVIVTPIVSSATATVGTTGAVPPEAGAFFPIIDLALDVQTTKASVAATATNVPLSGGETADGAAEVSIDSTVINNSQVNDRKEGDWCGTPGSWRLLSDH